VRPGQAARVDFSYFTTHQSDVITQFGQHMELTITTLVLAMAIAIPIGTLISRFPILYTPLIAFFGIIYTIPSLALLAFLVVYVGIGRTNALIALVAYAQFILVRNVVVGLRSVDPIVIDAARGVGMSRTQIMVKIQYPLALPVILGGVRIATVATIAVATIAALIDAGGLGQMLFEGINNGNNSEIEVGAMAVSLLAVLADIFLRVVDHVLPASRAGAVR
jgi:osmoprotectant transport system permease protein